MTDPVRQAATLVPVADVQRSVNFYRDTLGFTVVSENPHFAIVERGGAEIRFIAAGDAEALRATARNIAIYITVDGLENFYKSLRSDLKTLPEGRVRPPFDQPYGMREFHVKDPDGCLLFFAEAIG